MDPQSVLVLAAELGIGLAGFASVAAALQSRGSGEASRFLRARVNTLVYSSLGVALFGYAPMVLAIALDDPDRTWRISSLVYGTWQGLALADHLRSVPVFRHQPDFSRRQVGVAGAAFGLSIALNAYNFLVAAEAWPYLASLACSLVVAGSRFARLVRLFWALSTANLPRSSRLIPTRMWLAGWMR